MIYFRKYAFLKVFFTKSIVFFSNLLDNIYVDFYINLKVVKLLKYIDKFLKFLKTDRNTFATFILALISAYVLVDRLVELMFMIFTGVAYSYWGPIKYALAFLALIFAYHFSASSKFVKADVDKQRYFNTYIICLYMLIVCFVVQSLNSAAWLAILSVPNYAEIVSEHSNLFRPAFTAISLYIPLVSFYKVFKWLTFTINDTKDLRDSISDYGGISLAGKPKDTGKYSCEVKLCIDTETGADVVIPESKRLESFLAVGVSGSGKTTMIYEPMIARDMDRKYFFKEISKEMGYTALKTGIATLNSPYDNNFLNENFSLNMLTPNQDKADLYNAYMKKMILSSSGGRYVYKNFGLTYLSADYESIEKVKKVAKNYKLKVNLIDPNNADSPGMNPFVYENPIKTGIAISSVLKGLYSSSRPDLQQAFRENAAIQIIENLSILLKEMYPRLHDGDLPNLEDLLNMMNDFSLVEDMCKQMKEIPELADKYKILIKYFENNFYADSTDLANTKTSIFSASAELDNLLRYPGVKNILCNRTNNLMFDQALENGEITLVCTRRGDLGANAHKAFGIFFLLLMQQAVLSRPGNDSNRIPHFLYIDDFPEFLCKAIEPIFTVYRKYKVGTILSAQTLSQLNGSDSKTNFKDEILANCVNKAIFGNALPEDVEWWETELQDKREWSWNNSYQTDSSKDDFGYDSKYGGIEFKWKPNYKKGKIMALKSKQILFKVKDSKGKSYVGKGKLDFLESKYKEPKKLKEYNFERFTNGISDAPKRASFADKFRGNFAAATSSNDTDDINEEFDPIKTDSTDSKYFMNNGDAIVFDLNQNNNNDDDKK